MPDATKSLKMVEINLFFFAFLINFVWEMLQMPLFSYPSNASLVQINVACLQASAGDAVMIVIAFWIVAIFQKNRRWILHPSVGSLALFLLPRILMTVAFEAMATGTLHRWTYAEAMPILPGLGTGIAPMVDTPVSCRFDCEAPTSAVVLTGDETRPGSSGSCLI